MNKRILISLSVIAVVSVIAIGGTIAYFSDTETSTGNTFTAGALDLKIDNTCHYDGMICSEGIWKEEQTGSSTYKELIGKECTCSWLARDLKGDLFFNFNDIKPGDEGENTISLHVDYNDAYVCAVIDGLKNYENGCSEPESSVDKTCGELNTNGEGLGELQNKIHLKIWRDNGIPVTNGGPTGKCDNIHQDGEPILVQDTVIDNNSGAWELYSPRLGELKGETEECIGIAWFVPGETDNIIQGDSVTANISFYAEQARNNPNFTCDRQTKTFVLDENQEHSPGIPQNVADETYRTTYQPYVTWIINGDEIEFTFHNPTPWLFVFDVRIDDEAGTARNQTGTDLTHMIIGAGPLNGQEWGNTYYRVEVDGREDGTPVHEVTQTFTGINKIQVGLREGAERDIYFDWIQFIAQ